MKISLKTDPCLQSTILHYLHASTVYTQKWPMKSPYTWQKKSCLKYILFQRICVLFCNGINFLQQKHLVLYLKFGSIYLTVNQLKCKVINSLIN